MVYYLDWGEGIWTGKGGFLTVRSNSCGNPKLKKDFQQSPILTSKKEPNMHKSMQELKSKKQRTGDT